MLYRHRFSGWAPSRRSIVVGFAEALAGVGPAPGGHRGIPTERRPVNFRERGVRRVGGHSG
jgi:hypothetical protein